VCSTVIDRNNIIGHFTLFEHIFSHGLHKSMQIVVMDSRSIIQSGKVDTMLIFNI
jgi:hypothetical protein